MKGSTMEGAFLTNIYCLPHPFIEVDDVVVNGHNVTTKTPARGPTLSILDYNNVVPYKRSISFLDDLILTTFDGVKNLR